MPAAPDFIPVPRRCKRRDGWTEARQRGFIAALADGLDAEKAAQTQGLSGNGAYQLRKAAGGESFAAAWDEAAAMARGLSRPAATMPAPEDDQELSLEEEEAAFDDMIAKYGLKLLAEREARLAGRIVAADFYCRQLTWIEMVLCLGGQGMRLLFALNRGEFGLLDIASTASSNYLEEVRRALWDEEGGPERPAPFAVARRVGPDGEIGLAHHSAIDGGPDWQEKFARQDARQQLDAEEQARWEARARADAAAWAARERQAGGAVLERAAAADELEDEDDAGDHQQRMDQAAADLEGEAEQPEHDEDGDDGPEHDQISLGRRPWRH